MQIIRKYLLWMMLGLQTAGCTMEAPYRPSGGLAGDDSISFVNSVPTRSARHGALDHASPPPSQEVEACSRDPSPASPANDIREPGHPILGVNIELSPAVSNVRRADLSQLDLARSLNVEWVRVWQLINLNRVAQASEEDPPVKRYDPNWWNSLLEIIREAKLRGLKVLLVMNGGPSEVRGPPIPGNAYPFQQRPTERGVRVIRRFALDICEAGVDAVQLYNELNFEKHFRSSDDALAAQTHPNTSVLARVAGYAKMWASTARAVSSAGLACRIVSAAPASIGYEGSPEEDRVSAYDWIDALLSSSINELKNTSPDSYAIGVHPYSPFDPTVSPLDWSSSWKSPGDSYRWHGMASMTRIKTLVERFNLEPDGLLWATELGFPSSNSIGQCPRCLTNEIQAKWIDQSIFGWVSGEYLNLPSSPIFLYQLTDRAAREDKYIDTDEGYFGLADQSGTKPAFRRVKQWSLSSKRLAPPVCGLKQRDTGKQQTRQ